MKIEDNNQELQDATTEVLNSQTLLERDELSPRRSPEQILDSTQLINAKRVLNIDLKQVQKKGFQSLHRGVLNSKRSDSPSPAS